MKYLKSLVYQTIVMKFRDSQCNVENDIFRINKNTQFDDIVILYKERKYFIVPEWFDDSEDIKKESKFVPRQYKNMKPFLLLLPQASRLWYC